MRDNDRELLKIGHGDGITRAKRLDEARLSIGTSFVWGATKEGDDFWRYVSTRLSEIADKARGAP